MYSNFDTKRKDTKKRNYNRLCPSLIDCIAYTRINKIPERTNYKTLT